MPHKWDKEIRAFLDGRHVEYCGTHLHGEPMDDWFTVTDLALFSMNQCLFRIRSIKREGWFNIPADLYAPYIIVDRGAIYPTEEEAIKWRLHGWKTIRIEWEE